MRVRLNLATRTLESHRRFFMAAGAAGALSGVLFLALGWHAYGARRADSELRKRSAQVRQEMEQLDVQRAELERFIERVRRTSRLERESEGGEREGLDTGITALNPATGEAIPVWLANYVLPDYGTGAVMGVPNRCFLPGR